MHLITIYYAILSLPNMQDVAYKGPHQLLMTSHTLLALLAAHLSLHLVRILLPLVVEGVKD